MEKSEKEGFGFWSGLIRDVFMPHDELEREKRWASGTIGNIPALEQVETGCPRPWLFSRLLLLSLLSYGLLLFIWIHFQNSKTIPGLIMIGSGLVPLTAVVFFFELNARRNISFFLVLRMILLGGCLSLVFAMFTFTLTNAIGLGWMGASTAGIAEEIAKLAAVLVLIRNKRYPYILNGLLLGAAVAAGFAAFESAGYALDTLGTKIIELTLKNQDLVNNATKELLSKNVSFWECCSYLYSSLTQASAKEMFQSITVRAWLAPFGHVVWTAITAGGLWLVKGKRDFRFSMLLDLRFLGFLLAAMILHATWNSPWTPCLLTPYDKYIIIGLIGWAVALTLVKQGLRQLEEEKRAMASAPMAAAPAPREGQAADQPTDQAAMQTAGEPALQELIRIQTEYVRRLEVTIDQRSTQNPLGMADLNRAAKEQEENRLRPHFDDRPWYAHYRNESPATDTRPPADNPPQEAKAQEATPQSCRRWENYYKR